MLLKECGVVFTLISLYLSILLYYIIKYNTWMDRLFFLDQKYFVNYLLVGIQPTFLYALLLGLRFVLFPGITSPELTQAVRSIKLHNLMKLIDFVESNMSQQRIFRAINIAVILIHLTLYIQLLEKRLTIIYQEQDSLHEYNDKAKTIYKKLIKILYRQILKPLIASALILHFTLRYTLNVGSSKITVQSIKAGLTDSYSSGVYQKIYIFVILSLYCTYLKLLLGAIVNYCLIGKDNAKRSGAMRKVQFINVVLHGLLALIHTLNLINVVILTIFDVNLLDVVDGSSRDKLANLRKNNEKIKNINQRPLMRRDLDFYEFLADIYGVFSAYGDFSKEMRKYRIALQGQKLFDDLRTPNAAELYGTPDEVEARKLVQETSCSICLMELNLFNNKETIKQLNCKHCYHENCIRQWVSQGNDLCPICKAKIFDEQKMKELVQVLNPNDEQNEQQQNQNNQEIDLVLGIENPNAARQQQQNKDNEQEHQSESSSSQQQSYSNENEVNYEEHDENEEEFEHKDDANFESTNQLNENNYHIEPIIQPKQDINVQSIETINQESKNEISEDSQSSAPYNSQNNEEDIGSNYTSSQYQNQQSQQKLQHEIQGKQQQELTQQQQKNPTIKLIIQQQKEQLQQIQESEEENQTETNQRLIKQAKRVFRKNKNKVKVIDLPLFTQQSIENVQLDILVKEFKEQFIQFINLTQAQQTLRYNPQKHLDLYKQQRQHGKKLNMNVLNKSQDEQKDNDEHEIIQHELDLGNP